MAFKKFFVPAFLCAALGLFFIPAAHAQDSIWSALALGTNEDHPKEPPPALERYWSRLRNLFPYNQYELLGQHTEPMNTPEDHWLVPRKDFVLHVDSQETERPGFYRIKLDLYQEKKLLAEIEAKIFGQNILFIRGPHYDKGQIIIILLVK